MNEEDFEKRLEQQPMRQVPHHWREQILAAASAAGKAAKNAEPTYGRKSFGDFLSQFLSALFWPSPGAWAGLAGIWLAILVTNYAAADKNQASGFGGAPPGINVLTLWKEEEKLLAELMEAPRAPAPPVRPQPTVPRPRSERTIELFKA